MPHTFSGTSSNQGGPGWPWVCRCTRQSWAACSWHRWVSLSLNMILNRWQADSGYWLLSRRRVRMTALSPLSLCPLPLFDGSSASLTPGLSPPFFSLDFTPLLCFFCFLLSVRNKNKNNTKHMPRQCPQCQWLSEKCRAAGRARNQMVHPWLRNFNWKVLHRNYFTTMRRLIII